MTALKFLSAPWLAETEKIIRERITPASINQTSTSVLTVFTECPDGVEKTLYFKVVDGVFTEISIREQPYPDAEFRMSGTYSTYVKILQGETDPTTAIMRGDMQFHGNLMRAMGMISVLEPIYQALAEIQTDF